MSQNGRRRVVITGLGMVSPIGKDVSSSWQALIAGGAGAAEITPFDHTDFPVHFPCQAKDFEPTEWIDRKQARRMDRFAQFTISAARQAEQDARLDIRGERDRARGTGASISPASRIASVCRSQPGSAG